MGKLSHLKKAVTEAKRRVYQGSPHKYDGKLDHSKIGTGEGAQAYGYGHYLAENDAVAKQYAESVQDWPEVNRINKGLQDYLVNQAFAKLNRPQIQQRLKDLGGDFHGVYRYKDDSDSWKSIRVWWVPEFEYEEINLPGGEDYEAPF